MRILLEKNLAFSDQPSPILAEEVEKEVKARKALKPLKYDKAELRINFPTDGKPQVELAEDKEKNPILRIANFKVGEHVFPPDIKAEEVALLGNKSKSFKKALVADGYLPDHLELKPTLKALPKNLRTPPFFVAVPNTEDKRGNQATTIFPPDNRMVFNDLAYPWCTGGRVDTPLGQGSGVMVGPRHLLTVSHVIQWGSNNTAGWVRFRPGFFAPSAPFGDAWGTRVYYKHKVSGPTIDWTESMYDYVCVVLDRNIGNWTGWMGAKGYTDSWDGSNYWSHIGYPGDLTGGNRPTFQGNISLDGSFWQFDSHESMSTRADVWPGQSGGPYFGWWSNGPHAVAVQSSQNSSENNASGGQDMVDLILRARAEFP